MAVSADLIEEEFRYADMYDVIKVTGDRVEVDAYYHIWQPEGVELRDDDDYSDQLGGEWEPVTGHSGQYGYSGPVMHPSEFVGGGMAKVIGETPGLYATVVVEAPCELDDDAETLCDAETGCYCEPAGWMLLRRIESGASNE